MGANLPRKLKRMKTEKRPLQLVLSGLHGKVRAGAWCKGERNKYMIKFQGGNNGNVSVLL